MLRTFRAVLKGNLLEWQEQVNGWLQGDRTVQVLVTLLDEEPFAVTQGRGRQMADVLEKLAQARAFSGVDPSRWQREIRQDRELPERSE
ncbi:hypothetical protein [Allocoleopsis sp.]|uniref:hypothetical protein n=1 Tax=Allocoleopsis sp. TaxID=3088169 RepID=UPI002FD79C78